MLTEADKSFEERGLIYGFLNNPIAASLATFLILVGGYLSLTGIRTEAFPVINPNTVTVSVLFPGATPTEVEEGITRRVEESLVGLDGVKKITSTAAESRGYVVVELDDFADRDDLKDDIETVVNGISNFPPENAEKPKVTAPKPTGNVTSLVVTGEMDVYNLRQAAQDIQRDLLTDPNISLVELAGAPDYELSIEISEQQLQQYGLSFDDVARAIRSASIDLASGEIISSSGNIQLRVNELRKEGVDFENIAVRTDENGGVLYLRDIARVVDGYVPNMVYNSYNGHPAVFININKPVAEDILKVRSAVDEFMADYTPPAGVEVTEFRDQSKIISERINLLLRNALFGFALVFSFMVLMLDLRLAFWVCVGITTAFTGGFIVLSLLDVTLNLVSMFALIIVLGLVVDDAVVIGENIEANKKPGQDAKLTALKGVMGVRAPVFVGVLTTIAAFSPLLFAGGTFGEISRSIPIVVISILVVSLFEAFYLLPSHLSKGGSWSKGVMADLQGKVSDGLNKFTDNYLRRAVSFTGRNRYVTVFAAFCFFVLSIVMVANGTVGVRFFPFIEGNDISVSIELEKGAPLEQTQRVVGQIEDALYVTLDQINQEENQNVAKSISVTVGGRTSGGGDPARGSSFNAANNIGQLRVELLPYGARTLSAREVERRWRENVGTVEGVERLRFNSVIGGFGADIDYELFHEDGEKLAAAVGSLKASIEQQVPGSYEIEDSFDIGKKELVFALTDAGRAAGLTNRDLARQVRQAFFGEEVQRIQRGRDEVKVYVRYPDQERRSEETLKDLRIRTNNGDLLPLSVVATYQEGQALSSIERVDGLQVIRVTARLDGGDASMQPTAANALLMDEVLPALSAEYPRLRYTQAGAAREQNEDFASLGRGFLLVMLLIFSILAIQLRSYIQPFAIMVSIPLGIAGAIVGHFVLGFELSFVSFFGMVALSGVAVNASVVLVDYYNRLRSEQGMERIAAAAEASVRRFRPVLLTSLTTALGLGPLLFETSTQAQFLIPMAVSLGFGILVSSIMVLFVTPSVCLVIDDLRLGKKKAEDLAPSATVVE